MTRMGIESTLVETRENDAAISPSKSRKFYYSSAALGETTAALEIEAYSSDAEMFYRHSVGLSQLGVLTRQRIRKNLESLRDTQKKYIHVSLRLSGIFYRNIGEYEKADYWYKVAEHFNQNFIENARKPAADRRGLVLVVGNNVPK